MSIIVELAPEEEARLRAHAARQGQEAASYAAALLRHSMLREGQALAETLGRRAGCLRSTQPSDMAANSEAEFGKIMDEKQRQGHV